MADRYYRKVSLLCHFEGSDGGTSFVDSGPIGHTITRVSPATTETDEALFGSSSGYFPDGSAECTVSDHDSLELSGDFTIELAYLASATDAPGRTLVSKGSDTFAANSYGIRVFSGSILFWASSSTGSYNISNGQSLGSVSVGNWVRVAVTRSGNTWRGYREGVKVFEFTSSGVPYNDGSQLFIGGANDSANGYIDELRITKGVARYTGESYDLATEAFSEELPEVPGDEYFDEVALLMHADTGFTDASSYIHSIAPNGSASVTASDPLFGAGSALFDASSERLAVTHASTIHPAAQDFTVEFAFKRTSSLSGVTPLLGKPSAVTGYGPWSFAMDASGNVYFYSSSTGSSWNIAQDRSAGNATLDAWVRFAVTRDGDTWRTYRNGTKVSEWTASDVSLLNSGNLEIGGATDNSYAHGQIDEFRYTIGVARYIGESYTLADEAFADFDSEDPSARDSDIAIEVGVEADHVFTSALRDADTAIEVGVEAAHEFILGQEGTDTAIEVGVDSPVEFRSAVRESDTAIEVGISAVVTSGSAVQPADVAIEVGVEAAHEFDAAAVATGDGDLEELTAEGESETATSGFGDAEFRALTALGVNEPYQDSTGSGTFERLSAEAWLVPDDAPELPALTASGFAVAGSLAQAALQLRRLSAAGVSIAEGVAVGASSLSPLTASGVVEVGYTIDGAGELRRLRAEGAALNGGVAEGAPSLEELVASGLSIQESIAVGAVAFPILSAAGASEATVTGPTGTWVVNTRTGAVTRYVGYLANSFAVYNGRCLFASASGLYDTAGGDEAVEWTLRTGATDDKRANLKRLTEVLMGLRYANPIDVGVWTDGLVKYTYRLEDIRPNALHQVRVHPGKGLRSRYYKVELKGTGRFEADSLQMTMPDTTRRVG
jgi:hypothetical protein